MQRKLREEFYAKLTADQVGKCETVTLRRLYDEAEALLDLTGDRGMVSAQDFKRLYYAARQIMSGEQVTVDVPRFRTLEQLIKEEERKKNNA